MRLALYIIWFLIPAFFFLLALFSKIEKLTGKDHRAPEGDLFREGLFVLACVLVSVALDRLVLEALVSALAPEWLPLWFFQVLLLPAVLCAAAVIAGPSKPIRIQKAIGKGAKK